MRVLHVIGSMNCGGAETFLMNLYRNIDRSKIQFDFVVHTNDHMFYEDEILALGGQLYRAPEFTGFNLLGYRNWWKQFFPKHPEYQVVHGHIGSTSSIYLHIAKKNGRYTIAHSHNTNEKDSIVHRIEFSLLTFPNRAIADFFMGCSKQAGIDRYGKKIVNSSRFAVIKNGIDVSKYIFSKTIRSQIRDAAGISSDTVVVGHVGRFAEQKNHSKIVDVFHSYHCEHPNSVLWLFGIGDLQNQIRAKVEKLGLADAVSFKGLSQEINREMQAMDAFLFPSIYEGLGIALVEAQAAGLPCIVSDAIQDEADINAGLIKKLDLSLSDAEWAEAIDYMLEKERCDTSDYAKTAGFDINTVAKELQNFYLSKMNLAVKGTVIRMNGPV